MQFRFDGSHDGELCVVSCQVLFEGSHSPSLLRRTTHRPSRTYASNGLHHVSCPFQCRLRRGASLYCSQSAVLLNYYTQPTVCRQHRQHSTVCSAHFFKSFYILLCTVQNCTVSTARCSNRFYIILYTNSRDSTVLSVAHVAKKAVVARIPRDC